jgi:hypothetical protein
MFETFEELDECIITGANALVGLQDQVLNYRHNRGNVYILRVGGQYQQISPSLVEFPQSRRRQKARVEYQQLA